jgi:hypothetical protein
LSSHYSPFFLMLNRCWLNIKLVLKSRHSVNHAERCQPQCLVALIPKNMAIFHKSKTKDYFLPAIWLSFIFLSQHPYKSNNSISS